MRKFINVKNLFYLIGKNLTMSQLINRKYLQKEVKKLNGKILDLGCGNGEYSFLMAKNKDNQVVALESSSKYCQEIKEQKIKNIEVVQADGHNLPFDDNTFDACFCNTVLEHVKNPEKIIKEIQRVLKKNGRLIISIPFLQEIHADPYDFQRYTHYKLKNLLEKNEFQIIKTYCDYGSLNVLEFLLLGSVVWRVRLGFWKNFPFGFIYIFFLIMLFLIVKISNLIFLPLQKKDKHFMTMVTLIGTKK